MINVRRDDGPAAGDFITDKLGGDESGNAGAETFARMLEVESAAVAVCRGLICRLPAEILPDRDILHLGCDDTFFRIVHLGHGAPRPCSERVSTPPGERLETAARFVESESLRALGQVSVVAGLDGAAMVFL